MLKKVFIIFQKCLNVHNTYILILQLFFFQGVLGDYNYGYATPTSSKQEFRTPDGVVQGTYSYVDANGVVQTVNYVSDAEGY
jgi:hypothetical protein